MGERVFVVGVGMTDFVKPSSRPEWDYPDMVRDAGTQALGDAGVAYADVQHVAAGYCFGDTTAGQRAVYELGHTGVPVVNVNNACATGSTALMVARNAVAAGMADCALAIGFEKMGKVNFYTDRAYPLDKHLASMATRHGASDALITAQMFGNAGREHMERYGTRPESFARIAVKNHKHSVHNPRAQFRKEFSLDEVMASPPLYPPLTLLQSCPTSSGAAAAVVASERFVRERGLAGRAVEIVGQAMATDFQSTFSDGDIAMVGSNLTRAVAERAYEQSGLGPENVDVIELHDCFSTNELITYEGLGLCPAGKGAELIDSGATTYGGRWVVNPSGGLISKGHPIGATGLAQCAELTWQLRGEAGPRQVKGAKVALQHNLGLGGAAVVTLYRRDAA
ncbi:MAG TPA: lipid-transfer protein [Candidatus Eisenbacteria bacterium]|nr:lipid-transfer protein [Candidatus Eisenbacteria bacterium]